MDEDDIPLSHTDECLNDPNFSPGVNYHAKRLGTTKRKLFRDSTPVSASKSKRTQGSPTSPGSNNYMEASVSTPLPQSPEGFVCSGISSASPLDSVFSSPESTPLFPTMGVSTLPTFGSSSSPTSPSVCQFSPLNSN